MTDRVSWGNQAYAGFWRRFAGILIDGFILSAVSGLLVGLFASPVLLDPLDPQTLQVRPGYFSAVAGWSAVSGVIWVAYETAMLTTLGWTLGKRAVGVEVRATDGTLLSVPRAIVRAIGKYVSALPLYLGFLWAAWDGHKQAWHDKFASSYVLKRSALERAAAEPGVAQPVASPAQAGVGQGTWGIPRQPPGAASPDVAAPAAPPDAAAAGRDVGVPGEPARPEPERGPGGAEPAAPAAEPSEPAAPAAEPSILDAIDFGVPAEPEAPGEPKAPAEPEAPAVPPAEPEAPAAPERAVQPAPETPPEALEPEPATPEQRAELQPPPTPAPPPGGPPSAADPNLVAVAQAGISAESAGWLEQVAGQVDARLLRVSAAWRAAGQPDAARACAFGLLMGHLARIYPHMQGDLARVAEAHPSFSTLAAGSRLQILQDIAADPARATAWLGPLVGTEDVAQVRLLFD